MSRKALVVLSILGGLVLSKPAEATGTVLLENEASAPMYVHMRTAIAATPSGATRWAQVSVPPRTRALWLVPARPGAAVDWASDRWLDALDEATTPRVLPPSTVTDCPMPLGPERSPSWAVMPGSTSPVAGIVIKTTAADAAAYVTARGYHLSPGNASRMTTLYANGWILLAVELGSSASDASSGTLRVSDDGGAILPLALTGAAHVRMTVFAIGAGVASVPGMTDVDPHQLRWGSTGSNFETWRRDVLEGGAWLRESSSHDAIFGPTSLPGTTRIPSVAAGYFDDASCADAVWNLRASAGVVGTSCAAGSTARVPGGGAACVPSSGAVDPALLSCSGKTDLALALSALTPQNALVTRWSRSIRNGSFESNLALELDPTMPAHGPIVRAASFERCPTTPPHGASPSPMQPPGRNEVVPSDPQAPVMVSDGCGTTIGTASSSGEPDDVEPPPPDDTSESCSSDDSSGWEETDDSDGWDDSDSEGCSDDDSSSSSSSDTCSGSTSDSGNDDDDGWDTEDSEMSPSSKKIAPAAKKSHAKHTKKTRSPVSRFALLGAAILLPLRRRHRDLTAGTTKES
jgi:hypothetical protein